MAYRALPRSLLVELFLLEKDVIRALAACSSRGKVGGARQEPAFLANVAYQADALVVPRVACCRL